jgi:uncharacterized membrane protein YfcA
VLLWVGLSPHVANGTNRIGILLQSVTSTLTFTRAGAFPWRRLLPLLGSAGAGVLLGAFAAARMHDDVFRRFAACLLAAAAATVFINSKRWSARRPDVGPVRAWHHLAVFLMSVYGGFLQVGLGVVLLAFFVLAAGYDVVRGNAMKTGLVAVSQLVALAVFERSGQIDWGVGLYLAIGSALGGVAGAHTVIRAGSTWVRVLVFLSAIAGIVKLFWRSG